MKKLIISILLILFTIAIANLIIIKPVRAENPDGCWICYDTGPVAWCWGNVKDGYHDCGQSVPDDCDLSGPGCSVL